MERYTQKPQTQGERRTDNTPAPVKTEKGKEGSVKNMSNTFSIQHCWGKDADIAYLTGRGR
ncbi:MAG: hypothetical protein MUE81_05120 [Thermoflexibacter sp.]|jgi:hypothetical protein|nr:hypothetical protein [Thermoflexibacter sp.]